VERTEAAERQPGDVREEVRVVELGREQRTERGEDEEPDEAPRQPLPDQVAVEPIVVR